MSPVEISIWSAMTGALLLLAATAAADVVARGGQVAAWRGLAFVLLTGSCALLLSGLPEYLLGITNDRAWLPAKAAVGPLAGALALSYLGLWLGIVVEDRLIGNTVRWGSLFLALMGLGLAAWAWLDVATEPGMVLVVSAVVNFVSCVFAVLVAMRGAVLGDPLARRMAVACVCLSGMVAGLYAKALGVGTFGPVMWAFTALCCTAYFLIVTMLTIQRNKVRSKLAALARGQKDNDAVTGLPTGVALMMEVDDALWRSERVKRNALVIAVWVTNLYELSGLAVPTADLEIRTALRARLRRAVGFRNVVGLYHPRCFVVVVSAVEGERVLRSCITRLHHHLRKPIRVGALTHNDQLFTPQIGFGAVITEPSGVQPAALLDDAEQLAQMALQMQWPGFVAVRHAGESEPRALDDPDGLWQQRFRHDRPGQPKHEPEAVV